MKRIPRIGVGGPVGSGKTSLIEALVPMMLERRRHPLVITNDIFTREDADHARRTLQDVFDVDRIRGGPPAPAPTPPSARIPALTCWRLSSGAPPTRTATCFLSKAVATTSP